MKKDSTEEIIEIFKTFTHDKKSLIVSTSNDNNEPLTNYSPFVENDNKFYICVSSSMPHFENMKTTQKAHVMVLQDENEASHIYARQRLYFGASCKVVEDEKPIFALFDQRYGESLSFLQTMKDFKIIELSPKEKSLVLGFGAAYKMNEQGELENKNIGHK